MASTRAGSCKPLLGHSQEDLGDYGLPSIVEVLRVIAWEREKPKAKTKSVVSFCCPCDHEKVAKCLQQNGCVEKEDLCLLYKVKKKWHQAGIITVSDVRIKERLVEINSN